MTLDKMSQSPCICLSSVLSGVTKHIYETKEIFSRCWHLKIWSRIM